MFVTGPADHGTASKQDSGGKSDYRTGDAAKG